MKNGRALATAALILLTIGNVKAIDPPEMKQGFWIIDTRTTNSPGGKQITSRSTLCRDHAYDHYVRALAKKLTENASGCTTLKDSLKGDAYLVVTRCEIGGVIVDSASTTVYRSNSTHTVTHQTYVPQLDGVSETTEIEDEEYLGGCPDGSKPGDLTRANGTELHLGPP